MPTIVELAIGIKRKVFRDNDAYSAGADLAFAPKREGALRAAGFRCQACHYESSAMASPSAAKAKPTFLQVHHLDDDHGNNDTSNLAALDWMCHAYHHIGCDAPSIGMDGASHGMASNMRIAYVPELKPGDLNNLLRALGAQLLGDEAQRAKAVRLLELLVLLTQSVRDAFGTCHAKDFAAAMAQLSQQEYEQQSGVDGLRVIFSPKLLQLAGKQMMQDHPMPLSAWPEFAASVS